MSNFVTRDDDYGMFQPGGYFEYLDDERLNSLPPPKPGDVRTTKLGKDGLTKYNSEQVLAFIDDARKRPPFRSSRLQRLTDKTNMEKEWERYQTRFERESIITHWNKMMASIIGIFDDLITMIPDNTGGAGAEKKSMADIFMHNDRLFYAGLFLTLIAVIWKTLS